MENQNQNITLKTYRFILSNVMIEHLSNFAKVHQYDDQKIFKEEWKIWLTDENIKSLINEEIKRLSNIGCTKDIIDKMYKSARYYYRNKQTKEKNTQPRKSYDHTSKEIQEKMDEHIYRQINKNAQQIEKDSSNEKKIIKISPAESFDHYLQENKEDLIKELSNNNQNKIIREECENLIKRYKKTYKNRFYNIRVSVNNLI
uniref:Uncharacterized protein n=1 Tax=viral metagenome TaxID=1070528 RepID=A0A6C0JR40_9ZZZZ